MESKFLGPSIHSWLLKIRCIEFSRQAIFKYILFNPTSSIHLGRDNDHNRCMIQDKTHQQNFEGYPSKIASPLKETYAPARQETKMAAKFRAAQLCSQMVLG